MEANFKVRQDLAFWACDGARFEPGKEHTVTGDKNMISQIIAAYAAGSISELVLDDQASKLQVVESDRDSEKVLTQAMENGTWLEGHLAQFELDRQEGVTIEIGGE